MVATRRKTLLALLVVVMVAGVPLGFVGGFTPRDVGLTYRIDREWAKIWINSDGTIDLFYNITFSVEEDSIGYLTVGLPNTFQVASVEDPAGSDLPYADVSQGAFFGVEVQFAPRIQAGQSATLLLRTLVERMVYEDTTTNVGMKFKPAWWEDPPAPIRDLRVAVVLPEGVKQEEIRTGEIEYDNLSVEGSSFVVYWEQSNVPAAAQIELGVSFPKEYVTSYTSRFWETVTFAAIIIAVVALAVVLIVLIYRRVRRAAYEKPRIMIEALGPARGLTAVEAAVVVDTTPLRVLTMILFGLVLKRVLRVTATTPLVTVERITAPGDAEPSPRYYEIDFLRSVEPNGALREDTLARTYVSLKHSVDRKMRGYSREDTVNYYRSVVNKAWGQVAQADTPQLRGAALEANLEWLILDENYKERFRSLPSDIIVLPHPGWYWARPLPSASSTPAATPPPPTVAQPTPIQEFADQFVTGIENAANGLVRNAEDFAKTVLPSQQAQSSRPVRQRSTCVCACAACACACACVSCACACAGGGAR